MLTVQTNTEKEKLQQLATCIGAWLLTAATLIGATDVVREPAVVVAHAQPSLQTAPEFDQFARRESENETVHLPTKYDIGLRAAPVSGRR